MRQFLKALARLNSGLCRSRNPLLRDPEYAGLVALEADMRRKHMPVAKVSRAKTARLNQLLFREGAIRPSRATILNILGA